MLFTSIVLACSLETGVCAAFGGIAQQTEEQCYTHAIDVTVPMLNRIGPEIVVLAIDCIAWGDTGEPA